MKKTMLAVSFLLCGVSTSAFAVCKIAVGGPDSKVEAAGTLTKALQNRIEELKGPQVNVVPVSTAGEIKVEDPDYLISLKNTGNSAQVQILDLISEKLLAQIHYSDFTGSITDIVMEVEEKTIENLSSACKR